MRIGSKLVVTAVVSALLLASTITSAIARNLSVSSQNMRATWSTFEFGTPLSTIRCQVTFEGSLHSRTFAKVSRTLIGVITRAAASGCSGTQIRPTAIPWPLFFEGYTGTLPNITFVQLLIARFGVEATFNGRTCVYGNARDNVTFSASINAEHLLTSLQPETNRNTVTLLEGSIFGSCPESLRFVSESSDGQITVLNSSARVRLTLI
jgi:hypothetical protein